MHDPMVVAFEIRRPWPHLPGRRLKPEQARWGWMRHGPWWRPGSWSPFIVLAGIEFYFPSLITVWHVEPGGADSGRVCKQWKDHRPYNRWRWHVHHWKIQIPPLQQLRARLFDRCELCHRKGRPNIGHQWDSPGVGWRKWRSRPDLYHQECSALIHARHQLDHRAQALTAVMNFATTTTGRDEHRILELLTASQAGMPYLVAADMAQVLGYEAHDGRWRKAEPVTAFGGLADASD